jgi:hypothetical protein
MIIARILQRRRRAEVRENDSLPPFPVKECEIGGEELVSLRFRGRADRTRRCTGDLPNPEHGKLTMISAEQRLSLQKGYSRVVPRC